MSFHSSRTLIRSLTPALAAVLLHIGTAAAGDAQQQARELLLGVPSALPPTAQSAAQTHRSAGDAQESARQLLLGVTTPASGQQQTDLSRATEKHVRGDAQVLAREVLVGRRGALAAGS
jgi:glycosyltransferase A (GT-A) superfamily protein (DUF2064 family)